MTTANSCPPCFQTASSRRLPLAPRIDEGHVSCHYSHASSQIFPSPPLRFLSRQVSSSWSCLAMHLSFVHLQERLLPPRGLLFLKLPSLLIDLAIHQMMLSWNEIAGQKLPRVLTELSINGHIFSLYKYLLLGDQQSADQLLFRVGWWSPAVNGTCS